MNQEIKRKWITALRSGEFEQGIGCLKKDNQYCCLGVLCELYYREKGGEWRSAPPEHSAVEGSLQFYPNPERKLRLEELAVAPIEVVEWAGISAGNPTLGEERATVLNDDRFSFNSIANLIEEHL